MKDSAWGRLLGVLVAPGETFRSIAERPTWVAPLVVLAVLSLAAALLIQMKTDPEEMVRAQFEMLKMDVPQEQIDKAIEQAENQSTGAKVALSLLGIVVQVAIYFIVAGLFLAAFRLFGSEIDYVRSLATTLHGYMPAVVAMVLNLPLMLSRESLTFEEVVGGGVLVSSLKPLAPEDASSAVEGLLGSADLFSIWTVVLLAIGYKIVARVSMAVAAGVVILFWLIYVGGKVGLMALFTR